MLGPHSYQPPEDGLPPDQVRILSLRAEPWPEDGHRVRVRLDVTSFKERPNIEVSITGENGQEAANITIIECIDTHMVFTMHIRGNHSSARFTLSASLSYPEIDVVDQKSEVFEIPVLD